jgi:O-antigen/teichoic acid export membrane protein
VRDGRGGLVTTGANAPALDPSRSPASITVNVIANFGGQAIASLVAFVCVPIILRLLGAETVGLIGFSVALQALLRVLDLGFSAAVVRQMARLGHQPGRHDELAEFHLTFERLFFGAGLAVAALTVTLSPFIARHWLHSSQLGSREVALAAAAIGAQCAVLFVASLYHGTLMGLERQLQFNVIRTAEICASQVGGVLVLILWLKRVEVLFGWQLAVSLIALAVYARAARAALPTRQSARFHLAQVRNVWPFAAGMAGITATGTLLANMDKVLLSRWLKLASFGYYTLAYFASSLVSSLLVAPVFNALFPRHCALVEHDDEAGERRLYHLSIQFLVVAVWPVAAILWAYARYVLQLWVREPVAVAAAERVLPWLAAGVALNTLMVPAYMIQLANAWTSLGVKLNAVLLAVFGPSLYVMTTRWGAAGAAANFALMQGTYLLVGLPLTHRRLLRAAFGEVVWRDMLPGVALCALAALGLAATRDTLAGASATARYAIMGAAWITLTAATALACSRVRGMARQVLTGGPPF